MNELDIFLTCFEEVTRKEIILRNGKDEEECALILKGQLEKEKIDLGKFLDTDKTYANYKLEVYDADFKKVEHENIKYMYVLKGEWSVSVGYIFKYNDQYFNVFSTESIKYGETEKNALNEIFHFEEMFSVIKFCPMIKKEKTEEMRYQEKIIKRRIMDNFYLDFVEETTGTKWEGCNDQYDKKEKYDKEFRKLVFSTLKDFFKANKRLLNFVNLKTKENDMV